MGELALAEAAVIVAVEAASCRFGVVELAVDAVPRFQRHSQEMRCSSSLGASLGSRTSRVVRRDEGPPGRSILAVAAVAVDNPGTRKCSRLLVIPALRQ